MLVPAYVSHHRYHKNLEKAKDMGVKKALCASIAVAFSYFFIYLAHGLSFWYGCTLVLSKEYTIGNLLAVSRSFVVNLYFSTLFKTEKWLLQLAMTIRVCVCVFVFVCVCVVFRNKGVLSCPFWIQPCCTDLPQPPDLCHCPRGCK